MVKKVFGKIPIWVISISVLVLLVGIGYGILFFANNRPPLKPPAEFLTARQRGAEISQKIVELASSTNGQIKEINSLDLSGDYLKALSLIDEVKNKNNNEARNQAIKLADEMRKMAESLDKISVVKSRQLAIEAITSEMSLITNFMDYTSILDNFLNNLRLAIATSKSEYRQAAETNLSDLNAKTWTINNLNQQFISQMREFDNSFSR